MTSFSVFNVASGEEKIIFTAVLVLVMLIYSCWDSSCFSIFSISVAVIIVISIPCSCHSFYFNSLCC